MRTFLESPIFSKFVYKYLTDEEYAAVQQEIMDRPNDPVVPGSGGVRKKRWAQPGRGKRGGVRIIYYVKTDEMIWMLTIYSKTEETNIPGKLLGKIREALEHD